MTRRGVVGAGSCVGLAMAALPKSDAAVGRLQKRRFQKGKSPWPLCLDTATIRPASLNEKVAIAATAGFDAIEVWTSELEEFEKSGGNLKDVGKEIRNLGLIVPNVIGLWDAIPATQEQWEASLPLQRNRMRMAQAIGAQHIQVVPLPRRPWREFDPRWAADRYRDLLEIGLKEFDITPAVVFVSFLEGARRMGQAAQIAIDADHPKARIIPDTFHMHIVGSGFRGLRHIRGDFIAVFSISDAPAEPGADKLREMPIKRADEYRLYPGDGTLPLVQCLKDLAAIGYTGAISLELYNPEYYKKDLVTVAETGRRKTLEVIRKAVDTR